MPFPHPSAVAIRPLADAALVKKALSALAVLALLVALPACSGGGSDPTSPASFPGVASVEGSSYALINRARSDEGRDRVMLDPVLSEIARNHSEAMRDEGFFSHTDPSGSGPGARVRAAGVSYSIVAENLAVVEGSSNPADRAHSALLGNPGHRRNMLDGRFELAGVGAARSGSQYWITHVYLRP